jgi:hypothetical protein
VVFTLDDPPVRFATQNPTRLPAGVDQFVEAPIEAIDSGSSGNLPADSLQAIEGSVAISATVTNPEPTDGGSDRSAIGASDEDRSALRASLLDELTSQAEVNLQSQIDPEDLLLLDTLMVSQTLEESFNPPAGQPGTSLTLNMRLEFTVQAVSTRDLRQLARSALDASMPAGFIVSPDDLTIESVSAPVTDDSGATRWEMKTERRILRALDSGLVLNLVRGRSPETARTVLEDRLALDRPPHIDLTPEWWPWLPLIPFRISVLTQ